MLFADFSLLTAFIAGVLALFAPCCIGFLLPSYLGTVFKERTRVFALTGVFAAGIFTVFLPIGLGFGAVGLWLTRFHNQFFYLGSAMLVILGITLLLGKLPMFHVPITARAAGHITVTSVFTMGIFSGIGSACCAPVFAGVVALSALSGTPLGGVVLAAAYVLGMVAPLFFLSWAIDRTKALQRFSLLQRKIDWRVGPWHSETLVAHAFAGIVFIGAGLFVALLTFQGKVMSAVTWRDSVQIGWVKALEQKLPWLGAIPDTFWFIGLFVVIVMIVIAVLRQQRSKN